MFGSSFWSSRHLDLGALLKVGAGLFVFGMSVAALISSYFYAGWI